MKKEGSDPSLFFIVRIVLMGAILERMPPAFEAILREWGKP